MHLAVPASVTEALTSLAGVGTREPPRCGFRRPCPQTRTVYELDACALTEDQAGPLQRSSGLGHRFATHAQHHGDRFLGLRQLPIVELVEHEQQLVAQVLLQRVMSVGHDGLR